MGQPEDTASPLGPQVIFGIDREGRCTLSVGPALEAQGLRPGELVGQDLFTVYATYAYALRRALSGERFIDQTVVNGRILATYFEPLLAPDGTVDGAVGVATDMTELVRAQEGLIRFRALADASPDLIAIADESGRPVYLNPQVAAFEVPVSAENLWDTAREQLGTEVVAQIRARLQAGERWSGDVQLPELGRGIQAHLQTFPLFHPATGDRLGDAWIARDLTELRASEDARRAASADLAQFRALVEASRDFIAIAGMDGTIRYINPAGRELTGLPADLDVTGTQIADYFAEEQLRHAREVQLPAVLGEGHWEGLSSLRHTNGAEVPVEASHFVMRDEDSEEAFAIGTVQHDIRERLAADDELRRLAAQREALLSRLVDAEEAERATIAAGVHDDQIQALATVDLRLHVLRRRLSEQAPHLLEVLDPVQDSVAGALDRLRALIFELEPPDLERGLAGALSWAAAELFRDTPIQVRVRGEEGPGIDAATRSMAYRIVREALVNARKHSEARSVEVVVGSSAGGLQVVVTDDGTGIGPATPTSSPGHRGLTSMQDRAAVAGGRCEIGPAPGGGTRVQLWLPGPATRAEG